MNSLRAGVLGVGHLGAAHARLLSQRPGFTLVGIHDRDDERASFVATEIGTRAYTDPTTLLGKIDAAIIAAPTGAHYELGRMALKSGCHVLLEKPLATDLTEANELVKLAEEEERILAVGHIERFNGALLAVEDHLQQPRFIESLRMAPFQNRGTDVTVILDLMIHDIDLVLALTNSPLADVHAVGVPVLSPSIDIANARLVFESGTVANITASRVSIKPLRHLRLFQDNGYFSLNLATGVGEHYRRRDAINLQEIKGIESAVERLPVHTVKGEPLARELDAFADAISGNPSRLVLGPAGRDALATAIRITSEIEESTNVLTQDS